MVLRFTLSTFRYTRYTKYIFILAFDLCHSYENGNLFFSYLSLMDSHFRGNDRGKLDFIFRLLLFSNSTLYAKRYTLFLYCFFSAFNYLIHQSIFFRFLSSHIEISISILLNFFKFLSGMVS